MSDTQNTFRWPVRLEEVVEGVPRGAYAACGADTPTAVLESVARIGTLELGQLPFAPEMGLPALELLSGDPDPGSIETAIEEQEPDAAVTVVRTPDLTRGEGWERLRIEVGVAGEESDGE
jgi:hypothetical protein